MRKNARMVWRGAFGVLDIFLLPDTRDLSSYPEQLLDTAQRPIE